MGQLSDYWVGIIRTLEAKVEALEGREASLVKRIELLEKYSDRPIGPIRGSWLEAKPTSPFEIMSKEYWDKGAYG